MIKTRKPRSEWYYLKKNSELLLLLLPGALLVLVFAYVPMFGVLLAFKDFRYDLGFWDSPWVGFHNFKFFFVSDTAAMITRNTVVYGLTYMLLTTVIALLFAILMNEMGKRWLRIHQTAMFIPYCLSWVVVSYLALALLDSQNGYLNKLLETLGFSTHMWYLETAPWPYILISAYLWKNVGFSTLVYFAGIMGINQEYYEAAKIDGASRWQMATKITLPLLSTLITVLLILAIGHIFVGDFGLHYFIPNDSGMTFPTTDIIDTYVYRALRVNGDIGMSTAVGLYQSIVGLVLVVVANFVVRKINEENSLF
ncbi:sugar ABC transporter permease [Paenibacillus rhizovicinus]|uniref:Sugar ABC transporter permease n=1 Tax=Paenibacillus rhizovicinus TaxID=2704463 RepID=A0A6C0NXI4_9BACL|nr:ABC transporter permease subunit [Paenibacillus rhizovicinus]QHW30898.1 sugar ABC transporter permease [Paenibacillus rhizovicinus]